ncbi:PREDICTED: uncharacterized protein LOC104613207 [Nelumbo nucifera]|uniref:Uncharacterized protein LOC104613207 n=1 Tax=Nelumbo nucifera TaxID=4432 RepID=A0A1U8BPR9_NELNU|nr:PREDICTED: uncharacterized protein LOC104613207 [Nelumbo nucifera]
MKNFLALAARVSIRIGNGNRTKFWKDPWCSDEPLVESFPLLFQCASDHEALVGECYSISGDSVLWTPSFQMNLFDWEVEKVLNLLTCLQNQELDYSLKDKWHWKWNSDGVFSVKSLVANLSRRGVPDFPDRQVWNPNSPTKANFLVWTMALNKCLSKENLVRRGIQVSDLSCSLCGSSAESTDHLCIHCPYSTQLWNHFLNSLKVCWVMPRSVKELLCCWQLMGLSKKKKAVWKMVPIVVVWSIWTERNTRIFSNKILSPEELIQKSVGKLISWVSVDADFRNYNVSNVFLSSS